MRRDTTVVTAAGLGGLLGSRATLLGATSVGVLAGLTSAAWITMRRQADVVTRMVEAAALEMALAQSQIEPGITDPTQLRPPQGDGVYLPDGTRLELGRSDASRPDASRPDVTRPEAGRGLRPLTLAMLGDSTSVGYGTRTADELPGVMLARDIAIAFDRPVRLVSHGLIGSGAADLPRQIAAALLDAPDVVVINTGANDVRDTIPPQRSAAQLGAAVATLRAQQIPVVVGTCPDFGVISPIPQPLRALVATWSRRLASLQAKAVSEAGGRPVLIGRLVSPQFLGRPDLFSPDRFHPSGLGYVRAVAALQPVVEEALADALAAADDAAAHRIATSTAS